MDRSLQGLKIIIRNSDGTSSDITMYSDDGKLPSTIEFGGAMGTADVKVSEVEVAEDEPLIEKQDDNPESSASTKKGQWVEIYSTVQESLTALCALVTSVMMIMTLVKFFSTSHIAGTWPANPKIYPTYLLLVTSLITLTIDVISLGERYCFRTSAKKVDTIISKMRYALLVFQAIGSATSAGVFRGTANGNSGQDLYGWACSDAADQMASVNSSGLICNSNKSSSILSLLQTSLHVLSIIITVVTMLGPKGTDGEDTKDNGDEESGIKSKVERLSSRKLIPSINLGDIKKSKGSEKPDETAQPNEKHKLDAKVEPEEPQADMEAIKSIVRQSQSLYTRLQPSGDPQDISHYGAPETGNAYTDVDMNTIRNPFMDTDINSRQVAYDGYDMQDYR